MPEATRNPYRTYSDGSPKVPHLGAICADPDRTARGQSAEWGHRVCGGWYCTCPCHDSWDIGSRSTIGEHADHEWEQVGDCVYCTCSPGLRLYQGTVCTPDERKALAAVFDASHNRTADEWAHMRREVLAARAHGGDE